MEHNDSNVKDALRKAIRTKKEDEELKLIDPAKAEEMRLEANALYEKGDFPNAIKVYNEAVKRDPKNKLIYSNRSQTYIKLIEFASALKDAEKEYLSEKL